MIPDIRQATFWEPPLPELAAALQTGLRKDFKEVEVDIQACPDLRQLGCAFAGLGGRPFLIELGGEPLVHNPRYRRHGNFDLDVILGCLSRQSSCLLGAGFPSLVVTGGKCGELIPCLAMNGQNLSKLARVGERGHCVVKSYASHLHGGLGNLYVCDGLPSDVIRLEVQRRSGEQASLPLAIRTALHDRFSDCGRGEIALGGVIRIVAGQVRAHISPDFECIRFPYYDADRNEVFRPDFLRYYQGMGPDLTCMSVLWTGDPTGGSLHLRPTGEHTHFFSTAGRSEAGHYHFDVTPDTIHYIGYFHPAGHVARVANIYRLLETGSEVQAWWHQ